MNYFLIFIITIFVSFSSSQHTCNSTISSLGNGTNGIIYSSISIGNILYVGGAFNQAGGISANRIAGWNGADWFSLGNGIDNLVFTLTSIGNILYVGGAFNQAGGIPNTRYIAEPIGFHLKMEQTNNNNNNNNNNINRKYFPRSKQFEYICCLLF